MFKLIFLIRNFFKEKRIIKKVNILNKKLKTTFSYYLVLEEIDFLKAINIEKDNPTMKRYEHLNNVLLLWLDGIKEEVLYKYKNHIIKYHSIKEINDLFKDFKDELIKYLIFNKILSKTIYLNKTIEDDDIYLESFIKFDLKDIENYKYLLRSGLSLISEIKKNYESNYDNYNKGIKYTKKNISSYIVGRLKNKYKEEYYTFDKIIYFGPSTFNFYNKFIKIDKEAFEYNIYKKLKYKEKKKQRRCYYKKASKERINLYNLNTNVYRINQIEGEISRINNFEYLIEVNNYDDFYFDTFMWRLLNDLSYLSIKLTGGLKRVIDDLQKAKIKGLSKYSPERTLEALMEIDDIDLMPLKTEPIIKEEQKATKNMSKLIKDQIIIKELEKEEKVIEKMYEQPVRTKEGPTLKR